MMLDIFFYSVIYQWRKPSLIIRIVGDIFSDYWPNDCWENSKALIHVWFGITLCSAVLIHIFTQFLNYIAKTSMLDNLITFRISTTFRGQRVLIGAKCKSGSEAKEVEFLRSLHSVCLTFLMGLDLHFPQNCHWKHLLEKCGMPHTNSTGNRTWIALCSSCKWRSLGSSYCNSVHLRPPVDALLSGNSYQNHRPAIQNLHTKWHKSENIWR